MMHDEEVYGPAARYSEYQQGDTITYRAVSTGEPRSGEILAVCAAGLVGSKPVPLHYMVENGNSFPVCVYPRDIVNSDTL